VLKWVDANGGDSSTLKFAETPVPVMAPALAAGRIDAACLLEPSLTAAKDDIRIFGKCYDAIAKSLMITSHFANTAWLDAHPDAAHAFIGALRESARWANRNLAASSAILADKSKIPLETIAAMHRVQFGEALDPALIQPVIDASAQYKFLPKDFNVSEMFWAQAR
jgi:NitT/TauT family transport system substrate-binding protein